MDHFVYPVMEEELRVPVLKSRVVHLPHGSSVMVSCPGQDNHLLVFGRVRPTRPDRMHYSRITCTDAGLMHVDTPIKWSDLSCLKKPQSSIRMGKTCGQRGTEWIIGWDIKRRFFKQITLCYNVQQETPLFTSHRIYGRNIDAKVVKPSRPGFRDDGFFSSNVRNAYTVTTQISLLQRLLNTVRHLTGENQHFLAKGHLAPDGDFILEPEQDATYQYANAVPQWQAINNGNWKRLEFAVRRLARMRGATFEVWTGTHGVLRLPNNHGHPVFIFLGNNRMPVPALMWKVIHDPSMHTAVAIVMVNDVGRYGTFESGSLHDPPCLDQCYRLPWVNWEVSDPTRGRTFCCSVHELQSAITDFPSLGPVGLLY
ncbi:uncharacterized protein [Procambarus clarkii]|nr:uncharacterized protein LOC123764496 isoform X2 [Procambarus clarkii]